MRIAISRTMHFEQIGFVKRSLNLQNSRFIERSRVLKGRRQQRWFGNCLIWHRYRRILMIFLIMSWNAIHWLDNWNAALLYIPCRYLPIFNASSDSNSNPCDRISSDGLWFIVAVIRSTRKKGAPRPSRVSLRPFFLPAPVNDTRSSKWKLDKIDPNAISSHMIIRKLTTYGGSKSGVGVRNIIFYVLIQQYTDKYAGGFY